MREAVGARPRVAGAADDLLADLRGGPRIRFLERLGEGAVGVVDRVFDERLGRVVARKTLKPALLADEQAVRTFVNEAKILAQLDHGSVMPIFDSYIGEDGAPVYTMQEISGTSLAQLLRIDRATGRAEPLPLGRTLRIVRQIGDALAHAHERGVIHLDLKPENVIVLDRDRVVLVDWGAARVFAPDRAARRLEATPELARFVQIEEDDDYLVGTPRYMSPEQTVARRSELGSESDVFSLGVLFYQMLTGRLPFEATDLETLLSQIREETPPEPRALDRGIHARLSGIVMRMLEKPEWERYSTLAEMIADLEAFRSTAAEFPLRSFEPGELLFREGDDGDWAGVIVSGAVEVFTEGEGERRVLGRVLAGESVGELSLLAHGQRSASAVAVEPTALREISAAALTSEVERLSPWIVSILRDVVERFIDRSDRLVELLGDSGDD